MDISIDGKITNIWSEVGRKAKNLVIVPHGDETYPCISFCDILCGYIRRTVKTIRAKEIEKYFKNVVGIDFVKADFVGESDDLVPRYPYSLNPENFYPHPTIFIESSEILSEKEDKSTRKAIIEDSELFKLCLSYAEETNGCVTFFDISKHQKILRSGDIIICLDDKSFSRMNKIKELNRIIDFKVLNLDDAYDLLLSN